MKMGNFKYVICFSADSHEPSTRQRNLSEGDNKAIVSAAKANSDVAGERQPSGGVMNRQGRSDTYNCSLCNYTARSRGELVKHALRNHVRYPVNESGEERSRAGNDQNMEAPTNGAGSSSQVYVRR